MDGETLPLFPPHLFWVADDHAMTEAAVLHHTAGVVALPGLALFAADVLRQPS